MSVDAKFSDAANSAADSVNNGEAIGGSLTVIQGSLVYNIRMFDGTNVYSVIVDAGKGKVLNTSQGHPMQLGALLVGENGMSGLHIGANAWKS